MESGCTGHLLGWGSGEFGQHGHADTKEDVQFANGRLLKDPVIHGRIKIAACGSSHSIAVTDSNEIFTWGNGTTGQLACPDWGSHLTPFKVTLEPPMADDANIIHVTCGSRHTMVLLSNGHVHAFGNNFFAQLGYDFRKENYKENQSEPKVLGFLDHCKVVQTACGDKHSMVLLQDGTVAMFGNNAHGQIGDGTRSESVVPKPVELEVKVKDIACGSHHSMLLSDSGDVYVWGYSKACGHRRHDVLTPQLKVKGRHVVQMAGGGTHSLVLTESGRVLSWGFGLDGQLGLGDISLATAQPRILRSPQIDRRVCFVACGESYSAAITVDGELYLWGKNSHVISLLQPSNAPYYHPTCVNRSQDGHQLTAVHSVSCGSWHVLALAGLPDRQPVAREKADDAISDDSDSDENDDEEEHDGMSSDGSTVNSRCTSASSVSRGANGSARTGRGLERSSAPSSATGPTDRAQASTATHQLPFPKATRLPTRLTLEEFYTLSDSSPSQDSEHPSPRSQSDGQKSARLIGETSDSPGLASPRLKSDQKDPDIKGDLDLPRSTRDSKTPEVAIIPSSKSVLCPEIAFSSPSPTSEISAVSESSLKKRMAENLPRNGGLPFRNRDWSGGPGGRKVLSPGKPMVNFNVLGDQELSGNRSLTPKAASRTKAASLTERANTMFISKSTADHFYLPRETSIVTKQCVALMDFENLRSGSVFDVGEDFATSIGQYCVPLPSSSNSSSRMEMALSPGHDMKSNQPQISASDTPSTMLRSLRMQDMMGIELSDCTPMDSKRTTPAVFNTPSPNFGTSKTEEYSLHMPLMRSRTLFGSSQRGPSKYYRKPSFPRPNRPKLAKPGNLSSTRQHTFTGTFHNGSNETQNMDFSRQNTSTGLEIMASSSSARLRGIHSQPELWPSISLTGQGEAKPRRAIQTSATPRFARQGTGVSLTKPLLKDRSAFSRSHTVMGKGSLEPDQGLMIGRKEGLTSLTKPSRELNSGHSFGSFQTAGPGRTDMNLKRNKKS